MKKNEEDSEESMENGYICVQGILLPNKEQKSFLHERMRLQSSCVRSSSKLINKNTSKAEAIPVLRERYPELDARTLRDAHHEAKTILSSRTKLKLNPKKIIFGSKKLFNKLKNKKNLDEQQRAKLEKDWHDSRNRKLYSRGEANRKGNQNLRILIENDMFYVRMTYGHRKTTLVPFQTTSKKLPLLFQALALGIAYDVRIIERNNINHIYVSFKEQDVPITIGYENGSINIDMNSRPAHLAWTEFDNQGNKIDFGIINMPELYDQSKNKRKHYLWKYIHQLFELCKLKKKGLYFEGIKQEAQKKKNKSKNKKQNRGISNFMSGALTDAIVALFRRGGIAATPVPPYYTTIIGVLKYSPLYGLSGHVGPSMAIGHIGMGIEEKIPKAYQELLDRSSVASLAVLDGCDQNLSVNPSIVRVPLRKSTNRKTSTDAVLDGKKEAKPINSNLSIWGDVKAIVLTALSTRLGIKNKKILWIKLKANPSILKNYLHHGFFHDAGS